MGKVFMSIRQTASETGLSEYYIRKGVHENSIPHICSGVKILVNYPLFIKQLEEQSGKRVTD